jgi:hypothetical protein
MINETAWKQVNITYPTPDAQQRERHAVDHLAGVLPAAEADGLITAWFFIRKAESARFPVSTTRTDQATDCSWQ